MGFASSRSMEQVSIQCRKSNTTVITKAHKKKGCFVLSQREFNEKSGKVQKAREDADDKSWFVFDLLLIGWEDDVSFLDQSQSITCRT